jgi:carbon storage regulator
MLIVTRRLGEVLHIGSARVVVLSQQGSQVKLGVDAPKTTPVVRDEARQNKLPL